ncbi:MAG TPA: cupredoxin domain-containing protein [Limnochordia bacterium]|nr:cupredoxin domain-containing protein [Limnochordia bacterium]
MVRRRFAFPLAAALLLLVTLAFAASADETDARHRGGPHDDPGAIVDQFIALLSGSPGSEYRLEQLLAPSVTYTSAGRFTRTLSAHQFAQQALYGDAVAARASFQRSALSYSHDHASVSGDFTLTFDLTYGHDPSVHLTNTLSSRRSFGLDQWAGRWRIVSVTDSDLTTGSLPEPAPRDQQLELRLDTFSIAPGTITVHQGDRVTLRIVNTAQHLPHDFVLEGPSATIRTRVLQPGESQTLFFTASRSGSFSYYCDIPGHRAAGMQGRLIVLPQPASAPRVGGLITTIEQNPDANAARSR